MRANLGANPSLASVSPHFSHSRWNCSLESLATPFVESPSPPAVSCGGRRWRSRMRGALYEIWAICRRWSESARRRANDVLVKRPLIRLRHLLPQQKNRWGRRTLDWGYCRERNARALHIVPSFATKRVPAIPLSVREMRATDPSSFRRRDPAAGRGERPAIEIDADDIRSYGADVAVRPVRDRRRDTGGKAVQMLE